MDIGILNAISRREITRFTDLASIVQKYCVMESVRKTEIKFWDNPVLNTTPSEIKGAFSPGTWAKQQKTKTLYTVWNRTGGMAQWTL